MMLHKLEIKRISILILTMAIFSACSFKNDDINFKYIKDNTWQHDRGFKVGEGDFMEFDDDRFYQLKADTIFYKGNFRGIVYDLDSANNILIIKGNHSKGYYINTIEFTR